MSWYLLITLCAAIVYALASIFLKRALKEGATTDQTFHLTNWLVAVMFFPLIFLSKEPINWSLVWQPALVAAIFFLGNLTSFIAIRKGDVSIVTPLMGTKVVFVAIAVVLILKKVPTPLLWGAAFLTAIGIFLMGYSDFRRKAGATGIAAIIITLLSAVFFGVHDVILAKFAPDFGPTLFVPMAMAGLGLSSLLMWLFQRRPSLKMSASGLKFSLLGAFAIAVQALLIASALCFYDDATKINVVYASRGLWVILLVACFGSFFGNNERKTAGEAFRWRIIGTVLVTAAVIIAVFEK